MFNLFKNRWKKQIDKEKFVLPDVPITTEEPKTRGPETYLLISLEGDNVMFRSSCDDIMVFFSILKLLYPVLQEAALLSMKDQTKKNLLTQMLKESTVVVRASQVFGDKK